MRFGQIGFQLEGLSEALLRVDEAPAVAICITEIIVHLGELAIDRQCLLEDLDRFVRATDLQQRVTQIVAGLGTSRIALHCLGMVPDRLGPSVLTTGEYSERIVGSGA